ncbi:unnamed protein product [Lota lota]
MATPFKIPKRTAVSPREGSECVLMQSPLSRLPDADPAPEKDWGESSAGHKDMMRSGKGFGPRGGRSSFSRKPLFRDTVKSYLGIQQPAREPGGTSTPPHPPSPLHPPRQPAARPPFHLSNRWRPRRASDRLSKELSPQKKSSGASGGVQSRVTSGSPESSSSDSGGPSSDGLRSPPLRPRPRPPQSKPWKAWPSAGAGSGTPLSRAGPEKADRRLSLNRTSWLAASTHLQRRSDEERERERRSSCRSLTLRMRTRRDSTSPSEPIVLSSEEEDGEQEEGLRGEADQTTPPVMELDFTDLHVGLTRAQSNGALTITEHAITLPLKGGSANGGGECEVVVIASQVRGHGLWDGGVAGGGPAPSLLFLWVTDAQAKLLQTELSIIHPVTEPGVSCVFLLVVLSVSELQAALCLSLLDTEQYCSSSSLGLTQAVRLLSSLPPPLHTHLLLLLGQPTEWSNQRTRSCVGQRLIQYPAPPSKGSITVTTEDLACLQHGHFLNDVIIDFYLKYLLLEKVHAGFSERCHVFSSFFFKQLSRRRAQGEDAPALLNKEMRHQRVKTWTRHVDIFTKDFLFVPVNQEAHWYLLVICFPGLEGVQHQEPPVTHTHSHTYTCRNLMCVCVCVCVGVFPGGLRERKGSKEVCLHGNQTHHLVRPGSGAHLCVCVCSPVACILVMDSLKLSAHENACRLLRDYLQVEWQVRRGRSRLFTANTMCSAVCLLPLQDNSSDCGLYLLQYAESFLQNPVVHFDLPVRLEGWFPRQQIRSKRDQIRSLVLDLQEGQNQPGPS